MGSSNRSVPWTLMCVLAVVTPLAIGFCPVLEGSAGASTLTPATAKASIPHANITINGKKQGPIFQGIGAVSGGGGNSRLLIDYPTPERNAILDYLFKPGYGASLQLLKIEIGGDGNSSDGSEPSVENSSGNIDCDVGYEFWLAQQALRLNPQIKIYGLQWSAPGFVKDGSTTLWTEADIDYLIDWLGCAEAEGVPVSYLGGWNEHYSVGSSLIENWFVDLRKALDANGFSYVQIVAPDSAPSAKVSPWSVANDMLSNSAFERAVSIIGVHDICGTLSSGYSCQGSQTAEQLATTEQKPLWQSELGRTPADVPDPLKEGPGGLARSLNNSYIDAMTTGTLIWPLLDAMAPSLPYENRGLVLAGEPWSGNYQVTPLTWVVAQTTQATAPGWRYVDGADGFLTSGSYVTYEAPREAAWSMVLQTSRATRAERLDVHVTGGLPTSEVHVWSTAVNDGSYFARRPVIHLHNGSFSFVAAPGMLYTFTTLATLSKAGGLAPKVPKSSAMPVSYVPHEDKAGMPNALSPMEGAYEYSGGAITQTAAGTPVAWKSPGRTAYPYAIVGAKTWRNYTVSATVTLPVSSGSTASPGALLLARFEGYSLDAGADQFWGYEFFLNSGGAWEIVQNGPSPVVMEQGNVLPRRTYKMALTVSGDRLSASVGGVAVASVTTSKYSYGPAGLGGTAFDAVSYKDFAVTQ